MMKIALMFGFLMLGLLLIDAVPEGHTQAISDEELIIYYSFNEDTLEETDVLDLSGNGNDGFLHGNSLEIVDGKVGECMDFPGNAAQYISVRQLMYSEPIQEFSIAAWVKTEQRGLIASWDRSEFFRFAVGDDIGGNNGTTFVAFDTCCPIHDWFGKTDVADGEWHHLAATLNAKEQRIYVDGELDASTIGGPKAIGAGAVRFGFIGIGSEAAAFNANVGPTWAFNGLIDEFLLFHRSLKETEIEHLAKTQGSPFAVELGNKLTTAWAILKNTQ